MKLLLTLLGLVLVQLCPAQINTPQLIYQDNPNLLLKYFFSAQEGHLYVVQETGLAKDINVFKENGLLWKTISKENMLTYHYTFDVFEFINESGENKIIATIAQTSDGSNSDHLEWANFDVIDEILFVQGPICRISDTYFTVRLIVNNGSLQGSLISNIKNGDEQFFPNIYMSIDKDYFSQKDVAIVKASADTFYVLDKELQFNWKFSEDEYEFLGYWEDETENSFLLVKDKSKQLQVFNEAGVLVKSQMAGDSILNSSIDIYTSKEFGFVGVNNNGIYDLNTFKLLVATPERNKVIFSSNQKPYFFTENEQRDSFYLYDENADLVHSFKRPELLLNDNYYFNIIPTMHFFNEDRSVEIAHISPDGFRVLSEENEILWDSGISEQPDFLVHNESHVIAFERKHTVFDLPKIIDGEEYDFIEDQMPPTLVLAPGVSLRPNPFIFETSVQGLDFPYEVFIYGSDGKLLYSKKITTEAENKIEKLNQLARGVYYFQINQFDQQTGVLGLKQ